MATAVLNSGSGNSDGGVRPARSRACRAVSRGQDSVVWMLVGRGDSPVARERLVIEPGPWLSFALELLLSEYSRDVRPSAPVKKGSLMLTTAAQRQLLRLLAYRLIRPARLHDQQKPDRPRCTNMRRNHATCCGGVGSRHCGGLESGSGRQLLVALPYTR